MKNKVYCNKCRYFISTKETWTYEKCYAPQNFKPNIIPARDTYKEYKSEIMSILTKETPKKLNKNNDCKYYSKYSWWKIYW